MVAQGLQGLQGLQGFQALQGMPGLQGALLHDAQRRKAAELMAARQACAQQMSELVARHEHQIAAASRRAPPPLTPAATARGAYGCSPWGYGHREIVPDRPRELRLHPRPPWLLWLQPAARTIAGECSSIT